MLRSATESHRLRRSAMAPLADPAIRDRDFLEISEARYQARSTILTSQLPVAKRHEQIGDSTLADSILDRLVHNAQRIERRSSNHAGHFDTKPARWK